MGSDKNGDVEALDSARLKRVIKKLKRETKHLLRKQAKEYSKIKRKTAVMLRSKHTQSVGSTSEAKVIIDETKGKPDGNTSTGDESDGEQNKDGTPGATALTSMNSMSSLEDEEIDTTLINSDLAHLFEFDASEIERKLKKAIRKHRSVIVGDFFIGTCWRLQVCFATVVMAMVATYWLDSVCAINFIYFC